MYQIASIVAAAALCGAALPASASRVDERGESQLAKLLEGRVAGKAVDCITLRAIDDIEVADGTAILYRSGGRLYVNRPTTDPSLLQRGDVLLTRSTGTRLCSLDTVRVLDQASHLPKGFVALGKFVLYSRRAGDH